MDTDNFDVITYIFGVGDELTWFAAGCLTAIMVFFLIVNNGGKKKCRT